MRVLICGGAGYIGGALTDLLLETNHDFRVYDNLLYEEAYLKPVPFVYGDVRDKLLLKKWLDWADTVVWLAAIVGDGACAINPSIAMEINQDSVRWLSANFNGRIIFMSTCSVYGAAAGELTEESPTNPLSVYATTKLEAEAYLKMKNAIIFRLGTLFGLSDTYSRIRLDLVVNTMTARAVYERKLSVFGGEQYRPLLHVKDAAKAIMGALDSSHTGIYNLHRENMKMITLAEKVKQQVKCEIEVVDTTFEDSRNYRIKGTKARGTGFEPHYNVNDGISELYKALSSGRIKDLNNRRYSNQGFLETGGVI